MMDSMKSRIQKNLLRFDFSKKMIFILTTSILTAIFLIINFFFTDRSFTKIISKQSMGLEFHKRISSIYHKTIIIQAQYSWEHPEEKARLTAALKTIESFFSPIIDDLKISLAKDGLANQAFYIDRLNIYDKKFHQIMASLLEGELNANTNNKIVKSTLSRLKQELFDFTEIINEMYGLHLALTRTDGLRLDILINRLPAYQFHLSELLTFNKAKITPKTLAKIEILRDLLQENLNVINNDSEFSSEFDLEYIPNDSAEIQSLTSFRKDATNFSNLLIKMEEQKLDPEFIKIYRKVGYETILSSISLYDNLWMALKKSLSLQNSIYHNRLIIAGILLLLGTSLVLTPYLIKPFRSPLAELKRAAEKLAEGDLSARIPNISKDEVGAVSRSFNQMAEVFEQIMIEAHHFATHLSQSANEIFSTAKNLEKNLSIQEITIHDITQYSKNIVKTVLDFSKPLDQVNNTIQITAQQVNYSRESLSDMESIMQNISNFATGTVQALSSINQEIDTLKLVIRTLIVISDQINLLSLNTAIRSHKSGIKKFGFSIIAEKIRELAAQTAFTTLDFEEIVQKILGNVSDIVKEIDHFSIEIKEAIEDSIAVKSKFQALLQITQSQIASFNLINAEMQKQSEKTVFIDKTINELNHSILTTSQSVRNLYVEIEYLYHATNNLNMLTKRYTKTAPLDA